MLVPSGTRYISAEVVDESGNAFQSTGPRRIGTHPICEVYFTVMGVLSPFPRQFVSGTPALPNLLAVKLRNLRAAG